MSHGQLDIYKASAGSGKTHTLTHKYISFLLADGAEKDAYKHILAVTFTNKATEEMKSRIVKTLHELSQGKGEELEGLDPGEKAGVMARAKAALTAILHDYSNFQVCTIDRFFQQIFRSFARELGSFSNYRVELRDDDVLTHVVDEMLSGLDDDSVPEKSFDIINKFALDQLRYKSNNGYEKQLLEFAQLFVKEDFKVKSATYRADRKKIEEIELLAAKTVADFEKNLRSLAREAMATIAKQGLTVDDFPYKKSGGMGLVQKYANGEIKEPGDRLKALADKCSNDNPDLGALLTAIVDLFGGYRQYRTAQIVRSNVGVMKIFRSIYDTLSAYLKENNIMLLGETTQALNKMIDGSDTPFIYERVGSWIDHYLLDEFQDFSLMQWANFRPLLEQSLDSGNDNLIVGDVKQSIYRWRGSDWNTLDSGIQKEFAGRNVNPQTLSTNFRSDRAIVEFNNDVFKRMTDKDSGLFEGDETIARAYEDCRQSVNSGKEGHVKITYLDNESSQEKHPALGALKGEIEALDALGYPRSAVYVLVRTNSQASLVAEQLIADGIDVITDESLLVGASSYVQRVVAVLKYIVNPDDATNLQVIKEMGVDMDKVALGGNSIYDICESVVRSMDRSLAAGQMPYLMTFMDLVLDYMRDHGSDMAGFLKWWGEIGCQQAVSAPRGANAVRIMTIHKAKGLGCPVVIMPLFYEPLTPRSDLPNYMWCDDTSELKSGLLPVEFRKNAAETAFKGDYDAMSLLYKMDSLNTAYVAFTRAKHELIVFAEKKTHKKGISDLLYSLLSSDGKLVNDVYEAGERRRYDRSEESDGEVESVRMDDYNSIPMEGTGGSKRLALVYRGSDFFDPEERDAARARGIVMHDILSRIDTVADVAASVDTAVAGGELAAADRDDTVARVNEMLDSVKSYCWFSGEGEALNELSIIDTDGQVYRPDRVIIRGGKVAVVDYKFGERHGGYRKQVARYMEMLRRMGYGNVEGYLWYAAENNIEKVA
ncbi:MAG: UvrD-helicase domain-containing protein [Bacteroidales bacterium]|nr:UvrD-helicase domain-containing protein [Bacteroidales bacterium]